MKVITDVTSAPQKVMQLDIDTRPEGPSPQLGRTGPVLIFSDAITIFLGSAVAIGLGIGPPVSISSMLFLLVGAGIVLLTLGAGGAYRSRLHLSVLDELPGIAGRLLVAAAITELFASLLTGASGYVTLYALAAGFVVLGRIITYALVHTARRRGVVRHRTLIVGAGAVGTGLAQQLIDSRKYGLDPVAFFDPHPLSLPGREETGVEVLRSGNVAEAISATRATVVIVAFMSMREASLVSVIRECDRMHTEILCVPRLFELSSDEGVQMDRIGSVPLLRLRRSANRSRIWNSKRFFDMLFSGLAIAALSPILILLALGVMIFNGRPILFRQERLSKDSLSFHILKFRSLPNASPDETDMDWNNVSRQPNWFGKFLRASSLDELPQLFNILIGDMSIVGPRPERPMFASEFSDSFPGYADRHRVPAGLTGLAQVEGLRGDTSIARRAEFDNAYVETWTLWNDVKIILRTMKSVVRGEGR